MLSTNFASTEITSINREVDLLKSLSPNLSRYVYHTSLNFPQEEQGQLSNEKLLTIAFDYLQANGFTNNQYIIFRHHDSNHPHIHLLVNRISFDGSVVSDSNNYRKSEAILRDLEYRYNLKTVDHSNFTLADPHNNISKEQYIGIATDRRIDVTRKQNNYLSRKPVTRDEVGMIGRTGKSSNKLLLQELLIYLIGEKSKSITDLINKGEELGISFLFNQASTGRVSGVTYFFKDFKAKGQALGNQFKWPELIKQIDYLQERDSPLINEANIRTKTKYGDFSKPAESLVNQYEHINNGKSEQPYDGETIDIDSTKLNGFMNNEHGEVTIEKQPFEPGLSPGINIQICDDEDDAKKRRRRLRR